MAWFAYRLGSKHWCFSMALGSEGGGVRARAIPFKHLAPWEVQQDGFFHKRGPPYVATFPVFAPWGGGGRWTSSTPMSMRGVSEGAVMMGVVMAATVMAGVVTVAMGGTSHQGVGTDPSILPRKRWQKGQRELLLLQLCRVSLC